MAAPIERVLYAANVTIKLQIIIQTRKKTTAATTTPTTTSSSTTTTIELTLESAFHAIPYSVFHFPFHARSCWMLLSHCLLNAIPKSYCTAETVVINLVAETRMQQRWSCVSLPILKDAYRNWPHKIHQYLLVVRAEFKSVTNTKTSL